MSGIVMYGSPVAKRCLAKAEAQAVEFEYKAKRKPKLAVVVIGNNEASKIYVRNKEKACNSIGIDCLICNYGVDHTQKQLEEQVVELNNDESVDGIIIQLPIPSFYDANRLIGMVSPQKDVDGLTLYNQGLTMAGRNDGLKPCTPLGIMEMLFDYGIALDGKHVVVIGRSTLVGRPIASMLTAANATVTLCHSHTPDLDKYTLDADIIISAVGKPYFITKSMIKPGATVIDVGINRLDNGRIVGDCMDDISEVAGYYTPVPGGVGKMTVAMLMSNTMKAANDRYYKRTAK